MQRNKKPSLLGVLYTHNPFYLLSTCFVLYAIKRAFQPGVAEYLNPWALMASLTGFTLLAAVTAWVVVRFGKVWEDARSIVLVLVLMFLAISVSFDELLNRHPDEAVRLLLFGFGFSVFVSEGVLRSCRIRLPAGFRIPFYLILALFFAYPYFVCPELTQLDKTGTRWRIAAFPAIAGAITLLLLYAVRRGAAYVEENGTPWRWPWFPWTVFGFLAFAVCARSYSLSISFDEATGSLKAMYSAFGVYLLVPFLLAVLIVLMEIGIVERLPRLKNGVLIAAALLLPLGVPFRRFDPTYSEFLATFTATLASPAFLTVICVLAFFLYAWWRRVPAAEGGVIAMLVVAAGVGPNTTGPTSLTEPQLWPLATLCALQLLLAVRSRRSVRWFAAAVFVAAATLLQSKRLALPVEPWIVAAHLLLLAGVGIGWVFRDRFARVLSVLAAAALPALCLGTGWRLQQAGLPEPQLLTYFAGMTGLAIGRWYLTKNRWYLASGLAIIASGSIGLSWQMFQQLKRRLGSDVLYALLYGFACFLIAALISAHKAGVLTGTLFKTKANDPG